MIVSSGWGMMKAHSEKRMEGRLRRSHHHMLYCNCTSSSRKGEAGFPRLQSEEAEICSKLHLSQTSVLPCQTHQQNRDGGKA